MIPVQDNWLHIQNNFIDSCDLIINSTYNDNLLRFKQLGLFKLLLPISMGGRDGHLQDFVECQLAVSRYCVETANKFFRCASAPYLINKFGENVLQEVYGADNEALVYMFAGDLDTARTMDLDPEYDWIIVQDDDRYCLLNVADRNFEPERYNISLAQAGADTPNELSWFQFYNRVLTTSAIGGLEHVVRLTQNVGDSGLYAVLGMVLSEADEMRLVLHRNINHALLHIQQGEQVPMYDRIKYKVQSANAYNKSVNYLKEVNELTDNTEVGHIITQVESMDIEHLTNLNEDYKGYIRFLNGGNEQDLYL
tara:strand:+ start:935 stop:1861 length:927 start_codon:yes stop_codon:yes gene_type:complete